MFHKPWIKLVIHMFFVFIKHDFPLNFGCYSFTISRAKVWSEIWSQFLHRTLGRCDETIQHSQEQRERNFLITFKRVPISDLNTANSMCSIPRSLQGDQFSAKYPSENLDILLVGHYALQLLKQDFFNIPASWLCGLKYGAFYSYNGI